MRYRALRFSSLFFVVILVATGIFFLRFTPARAAGPYYVGGENIGDPCTDVIWFSTAYYSDTENGPRQYSTSTKYVYDGWRFYTDPSETGYYLDFRHADWDFNAGNWGPVNADGADDYQYACRTSSPTGGNAPSGYVNPLPAPPPYTPDPPTPTPDPPTPTPTPTVYHCANGDVTQDQADELATDGANAGMTSDQTTAIETNPCVLDDQELDEVVDQDKGLGFNRQVLPDGHICYDFKQQFDHVITSIGFHDALITVTQRVCRNDLGDFVDDGLTPNRQSGETRDEYINRANKPSVVTIDIGRHEGQPSLLLSYKLNGIGGNGVINGFWSASNNSPKGTWQFVISYNAGILGAGGGGLFAAFSSDYTKTLDPISVSDIN
jgi:hypothetical protein